MGSYSRHSERRSGFESFDDPFIARTLNEQTRSDIRAAGASDARDFIPDQPRLQSIHGEITLGFSAAVIRSREINFLCEYRTSLTGASSSLPSWVTDLSEDIDPNSKGIGTLINGKSSTPGVQGHLIPDTQSNTIGCTVQGYSPKWI